MSLVQSDVLVQERGAILPISMPSWHPDTVMQAVVDASPSGILITTVDHCWRYWNTQFTTLWQFSAATLYRLVSGHEEMLATFVADPTTFQHHVNRLHAEPIHEDATEVQLADGRILERSSRPIMDAHGHYAARVWYFRDITEQRALLEAVQVSETMYQALVGSMTEGVVVHAMDGQILACNPSAERLLGLTSDQARGLTAHSGNWDVLTLDGHLCDPDSHPISVVLRTGAPCIHVTLGVGRPDGSRVWLLINAQPLRRTLTHPPHAVLVTFTDISDRVLREQQLRMAADHDSLTGLLNRSALHELLSRALLLLSHQTPACAVLFIDCDHFKQVNDQYGHAVGDSLLTVIARRLEACTRPGDWVARIGGDEFAVCLPEVTCLAEAQAVAQRIHVALAQPIVRASRTLTVQASIGIAIINEPGLAAETLLHRADMAMYQVKAQGRGGTRVYEIV